MFRAEVASAAIVLIQTEIQSALLLFRVLLGLGTSILKPVLFVSQPRTNYLTFTVRSCTHIHLFQRHM